MKRISKITKIFGAAIIGLTAAAATPRHVYAQDEEESVSVSSSEEEVSIPSAANTEEEETPSASNWSSGPNATANEEEEEATPSQAWNYSNASTWNPINNYWYYSDYSDSSPSGSGFSRPLTAAEKRFDEKVVLGVLGSVTVLGGAAVLASKRKHSF